MSQVQTATQQTVSVQILQAGAQLAGLEPGGTGSDPQTGSQPSSESTGTITQIQLGCITHCFGSTSSNPATAAVSQQILAELGSLLPPPTSSSPAPAPAYEGSVTTETSCQQQAGQSSTLAQSQSATQNSSTIQLVSVAMAIPISLGSGMQGSQPAGQAESETVQTIWQFQFGCLTYCIDSTQVQQAEQSSTTIEVVASQPGPNGGGGAVITQSIWQVQIGCLSWCYASTQVQQASGQSTVVRFTAPAPSTNPPEPPGSPGSPGSTASSTSPPGAAATGLPPESPPVTQPPTPAPVALRTESLRFPISVGRAVLAIPTVRIDRTAVGGGSSATVPVSEPPVERSSATRTVARAGRSSGLIQRDRGRHAQLPSVGVSSTVAPAAVLAAHINAPDASCELDLEALTLVLLAGLATHAIRRARAATRPER